MDIETSQVLLNQGLLFLVVSGAIFLIIIAYYAAKLLHDLSQLAQNANETTLLLNGELKPLLKEFDKTLKSFNEIIQNTGEGMGNMKLGLESVLSKTKLLSGNLFGGFWKGFATMYSLFCKRK